MQNAIKIYCVCTLCQWYYDSKCSLHTPRAEQTPRNLQIESLHYSSMLLCLAYPQIKRYQGILVHLHKSWGIHSECFINDHVKVFHPMKQIVWRRRLKRLMGGHKHFKLAYEKGKYSKFPIIWIRLFNCTHHLFNLLTAWLPRLFKYPVHAHCLSYHIHIIFSVDNIIATQVCLLSRSIEYSLVWWHMTNL